MAKIWGMVKTAVTIGCIGLLSGCMEYHGTVVDASGSPIVGAKLLVTDVLGSQWVTYTDTEGYYFVDNLSDYGHDIFASKDGYITQVYDSQINIFSEINFVMPSTAAELISETVVTENDAPVHTTGQIELRTVIDGV